MKKVLFCVADLTRGRLFSFDMLLLITAYFPLITQGQQGTNLPQSLEIVIRRQSEYYI